MVNNLRRDDAEALLKLAKKISNEFDDFLLERRDSRSKEEFNFLKKIVGELMGAQYFEIIEVVNDKYRDVVEDFYGSTPNLKFDFPEIKR